MNSEQCWAAAIGAGVLFVAFNAIQLMIAYVVQSQEMDEMREQEFRRRKRKARARAVAKLIRNQATEAAARIAAALNINTANRPAEARTLRTVCQRELERFEKSSRELGRRK